MLDMHFYDSENVGSVFIHKMLDLNLYDTENVRYEFI